MSKEQLPLSPQTESKPETKRKVSKSDTGHGKNVANFEKLIVNCESYVPQFNPANPALTITALNTKHAQAKGTLKDVSDLITPWINAVNDRETLFNPLRKLATRIYNSFASCGAPKLAILDVLTIIRKIQGRRAVPIPKLPDTNTNTEKKLEEMHKYISASQMSMDNQVDHLYKLIQLLSSHPKYAPNEVNLQITTLTAMHTSMSNSNTSVLKTNSLLNIARFERNKSLYHFETGLVNIALEVKKYLKSAFGSDSFQYRQVSKIRFKNQTDLANKVK